MDEQFFDANLRAEVYTWRIQFFCTRLENKFKIKKNNFYASNSVFLPISRGMLYHDTLKSWQIKDHKNT